MSLGLQFQYRARDARGAEHRGVLGGDSAAAVARTLVGMGFVPVEVREQKAARGAATPAGAARGAGGASGSGAGGAGAATATGSRAGASQPSLLQGLEPLMAWLPVRRGGGKRVQASMALLMREMAALLRAGVPIMRALQLAAESTSERQVSAAILRMVRDLDAGRTVSAAARNEMEHSGLLGAYDVAMLEVGERTGRLSETFTELYRYREFSQATREQVSSAVRYPIFVILTCLIALVVVNIWVLPNFTKVFAQSRTELPAITVFLMGMSKLMKEHTTLLAMACAAATVSWVRWVRTPAGSLWWSRHKLMIPIIGKILQNIVLTRLSGSLASCISAGLTLSESLTVVARTLDNDHFEQKIRLMCAELARGSTISGAARNMGVLPPTMVQLFAIGEESGQLDELMREISQHYKSEVDHAISRLSQTLEPLLVWVMGGGVLILAAGVFMPMWDLSRATLR